MLAIANTMQWKEIQFLLSIHLKCRYFLWSDNKIFILWEKFLLNCHFFFSVNKFSKIFLKLSSLDSKCNVISSNIVEENLTKCLSRREFIKRIKTCFIIPIIVFWCAFDNKMPKHLSLFLQTDLKAALKFELFNV